MRQKDCEGVSRRRVLQGAVSLVPLLLESRVAISLGGLGRADLQHESSDALLNLGALAAVARIQSGDMKAEAYIARLLKHFQDHRDLNVATSIDAARLLEAARAVDRSRTRGEKLGRAAGLPFAVKDQIAVAGYPATGGNGALKGYIPTRHAIAVERLVAAGAIPFCKTSLPDMTVVDGIMHQISSHSAAFGAVHNPYDPARIPGGSSGGSGAILGARIVPAALGLDTNGSIRCPAAFCGVAGLRPSTYTLENAIRGTTRKRYPDDGLVIPPARRLDTIGPMGRSVADVAFLDALITGERVPAIDLTKARVAIPRREYWERGNVDPGVADVIRQAFAKLRDAGCTLVEIDLEGEVRAIVGTLFQPTPASIFAAEGMNAARPTRITMARWLRENAPDVTVDEMYGDRPFRENARSLPPAEEQVRVLTDAARRYADVYRSHGVQAIAFPTVPIVAPTIRPGGPKEPLGELMTINGRQVEEATVVAQNLFIAPRVGAPALSIPAGLSQGLPVGLELDGLPGHDCSLLGLGMAVEKAIGSLPPPSMCRREC